MAAATAEIIAFLDELLDASAFSDYGPNGLQVPGKREIEVVATGVSAHRDLITEAVVQGADLLVVHHGLFWRGQPLEITPLMDSRLRPLYRNDLALAAYHLPLDAHPQHGNNALLAQAIGADPERTFAEHGGREIGLIAGFGEHPITRTELTGRVAAATGGREPLVIAGGSDLVRRVGIVTGSACDDVLAAVEAGCDAFITGEPAERAFGIARDAGITFIAGGHHATETFGVKRLGELLAERFGVRHVPIDVANPI
ncbi:MAG: Nif3-like dinuclear metal center hexameric protein [Baekduia sp.]